ncbi:MAG TPA: hypothetical protein VFP71_10945, partial [Candidatus Angelobacter sp.]|nr:hypothetical protein [Candidatus Angelobacter sp.]
MLKTDRLRSNANQQEALKKLLDKLHTVRKVVNPKYTTKINPVKLQIFLELPDFPEIDIGNGGG